MTTRNAKDEKTELRNYRLSPIEHRQDDDGLITVTGHAAVFDQETVIGDWFREVIRPGAFKDAIGRDDTMFLINHEGLPLARTGSKTLILSEDKTGLYVETKLDSRDPDVARIVPKMARGDLSDMSFAFWPGDQVWHEFEEEDQLPLREIQSVEKLVDVAIVSQGAYPGTDIGLRSLEQFRNEARNNPARSLKRRLELDIRARESGYRIDQQ